MYVTLSCPHCKISFTKIPSERLKNNKAGACKAHLAVCPKYVPPTPLATPLATVATPSARDDDASSLDLAAELRKMREEREAERKERELERQSEKAKHEAEREAAKRRHEELMGELTDRNQQLDGMRLQLTDVQAQLTDKRQCLTDVREWGNLKEPDNTLVPQLTLRERALLAPKEERIALLEQQVGEKSRSASESVIKRAVEAENRVAQSKVLASQLQQEFASARSQLEEELASARTELASARTELEETRRKHKKDLLHEQIQNGMLHQKCQELVAACRGRASYRLPSELLRLSPNACKYGMMAFHPDRLESDRARELADPFFKQISASREPRSSDAREE